jgi:hypothetical protein
LRTESTSSNGCCSTGGSVCVDRARDEHKITLAYNLIEPLYLGANDFGYSLRIALELGTWLVGAPIQLGGPPASHWTSHIEVTLPFRDSPRPNELVVLLKLLASPAANNPCTSCFQVQCVVTLGTIVMRGPVKDVNSVWMRNPPPLVLAGSGGGPQL